MLDARTLSGFVGRMTYRLLSLVLRLTVLGNPDLDQLADVRELADHVDVENLQFGTYFVACAVKPISEMQSPQTLREG